jgi:hypothetical protein
MTLDTTDFEIIQTPDGYYRHVSHELRLLTAGWGSHAAAERNADMYRASEDVLARFRANYETMYGEESEPKEAPAP